MMRHIDSRFAGKVGLALMVAVLVTLTLAWVGLAQPLGPDVPNLPHFFWGNVTTDRGIPLPEGTVVTAQAATGKWTGTETGTVDASNRYGWLEAFVVPGWTPPDETSGAKSGDQIAFYVLGVRARLHDVARNTWSDTYPFSYGGHTNLDLEVALYPTITATAGPNGSISPSGAVPVAYGFDQEFTFAPADNYLILDVLVDGVSNPGAVAAGKYTFVNVRADHTIHVTFVHEIYRSYLPFIVR